MPSRWDMPSENFPARRLAAFSMPVMASTSSTRRGPIALLAASAAR
jgi:hypothetical protein